MPVIRLKTADTAGAAAGAGAGGAAVLSLDISFEGPGHMGLEANKLTSSLLAKLPPLKVPSPLFCAASTIAPIWPLPSPYLAPIYRTRDHQGATPSLSAPHIPRRAPSLLCRTSLTPLTHPPSASPTPLPHLHLPLHRHAAVGHRAQVLPQPPRPARGLHRGHEQVRRTTGATPCPCCLFIFPRRLF